MGHIYADIRLSNPRKPELRPIPVHALADRRSMKVPYAGPIKLAFEDRMCYVGALVMGDEVLLGAVPMDDMDLILAPSRQSVSVNPESPNIPHARVK